MLIVTIMENNAKNVRNKRRSRNETEKTEQRKKTFDKKKYRLQKYSNKYKINQWEERKKKAVLHKYRKEMKNSQNFTQTSLDSSDMSKNEEERINGKKNYAFHKAKKEGWLKKEEKKKRIENAVRVKTEREEALEKYKKKRMNTYKALSQMTKKGQPVMKSRMEILLAKIQQNLT